MTKILLADDSVTIQKVVELTFSDQESEITAVGDGAAALEKAQLERPDIILSDVIMPGMNGYELCQSVKSDPNLKGIPFLFLKGTFESFDEDKARECGADGFIVKPFESQELIGKVQELVSAAGKAATAASEAPTPLVEDAVEAPPAPEATAPAPPAAAAAPVSLTPEIPVAPPPPPPQTPPEPSVVEPPASPVATPPAEESFDLLEEDLVAEEPVAKEPPAGESQESFQAEGVDKEQDEDLWSEVSLRDTTSPLIEDKVLEEESFWGAADELQGQQADELEPSGEDLLEEVPEEPEIFDLGEEAAETTDEAPDEAPSEEAPLEPATAAESFFDAPVAESVETVEPLPVEELSLGEMEEEPSGPAPSPAVDEPPAPPAPGATQEIEKAVAAKIEEAIRSVLGPAIQETASKIVEEVAWEVIPDLAEAMIKSEIERIKSENS